jgi:hypothetical protein
MCLPKRYVANNHIPSHYRLHPESFRWNLVNSGQVTLSKFCSNNFATFWWHYRQYIRSYPRSSCPIHNVDNGEDCFSSIPSQTDSTTAAKNDLIFSECLYMHRWFTCLHACYAVSRFPLYRFITPSLYSPSCRTLDIQPTRPLTNALFRTNCLEHVLPWGSSIAQHDTTFPPPKHPQSELQYLQKPPS